MLAGSSVEPCTAFRWRHRFLAFPRGVQPAALVGIVEIDETYVSESISKSKGSSDAALESAAYAVSRLPSWYARPLRHNNRLLADRQS